MKKKKIIKKLCLIPVLIVALCFSFVGLITSKTYCYYLDTNSFEAQLVDVEADKIYYFDDILCVVYFKNLNPSLNASGFYYGLDGDNVERRYSFEMEQYRCVVDAADISFSISYYDTSINASYFLVDNDFRILNSNVGISFSDDFNLSSVKIIYRVDPMEEGILQAITGSFKRLGNSVLSFVKNGFVEIFCEVDIQGHVIGPSPVVWYSFALLGISLCCGLCYYIVNMLRRSK